MHLRYLLLTILGLSIAGLVGWALDAPPNRFVSVTSPIVLHYQFGLLVNGPSPDLTIVLYRQSIMTGLTVQLLRIGAPVAVLFFVLGVISVVMVVDTIRSTRKSARQPGSR